MFSNGADISARETGSNKQTSSKSCALSLVRQLYHLNVIEAFSGRLRQPKATDAVKPFSVNIDPGLIQRVHHLLEEFQIEPPSLNPGPEFTNVGFRTTSTVYLWLSVCSEILHESRTPSW